jgi:hypothetical protein
VLVVKMGPPHFEPLAASCVAGDIQICIDRTFGLDEEPEALAHVGEGRALGKVVVVPNCTMTPTLMPPRAVPPSTRCGTTCLQAPTSDWHRFRRSGWPGPESGISELAWGPAGMFPT